QHNVLADHHRVEPGVLGLAGPAHQHRQVPGAGQGPVLAEDQAHPRTWQQLSSLGSGFARPPSGGPGSLPRANIAQHYRRGGRTPRNSQSPPSAVDRTSSLSVGCAPRPAGTGSGPATTWLRNRPSPSTSTSTTSPGWTGREPAGVPDSSTSPGYSVIV